MMKKRNTAHAVKTIGIALVTAAITAFIACNSGLNPDGSADSTLSARSGHLVGGLDQWTAITDTGFTTAFGSSGINAIAYGTVTGRPSAFFIAGGANGKLAYSENGINNWVALDPGISGGAEIGGIAFGDGTVVLVADNGIVAYSDDPTLTSWTTLDSTETYINGRIYAVVYDPGEHQFIIGGAYGAVSWSGNGGESWTGLAEPLAPFYDNKNNIRALAYAPAIAPGTQGTILAVGGKAGGSDLSNAAMYAVSGALNTWTDVKNEIYCQGAAYGDDVFVVVGYKNAGPVNFNAAYAVPDQSNPWTWEQLDPTQTEIRQWIQGVTYGNGYFVAGGIQGSISYSDDGGVTWTAATGSTDVFGTAFVRDLAYGAGIFIAVGDSGVGAYSVP